MKCSTRSSCQFFRLLGLLIAISPIVAISPVQSQPYPAQPYPGGAAPADVLQPSDQGQAVADLQQRLSQLGYYNGPANGYFDPATQAAVTQFQQEHGLVADGIVGAATISTLYQGGAAAPEPGAAPFQGDNAGESVTTLQQQLVQLGYYNGPVSGTFDEQTKMAVMSFQREHGLAVDGIVGNETAAALSQSPQATPQAPPQADSSTEATAYTPATPTDGLLQLGDTGAEVSDLQTRLQALGYYDGPISGSFGSQTQTALVAFQQAQGLTADGIAGPRVNAALESTTTTEPQLATATQPTVTQTASQPSFSQATAQPSSQPSFSQATTQPATGAGVPIVPQATSIATAPGQPQATVQVPALSPAVAPLPSSSIAQSPMPAPQPGFGSSSSMPVNEEGRFSVIELQRRLQLRGFEPGDLSGVYDATTQNAITQAQQAYGLSQSDLFGN